MAIQHPTPPAPSSLFDLPAARAELRNKTLAAIEHATSCTWGARACVAFENAASANDALARQRWLLDGENYRQECLEHAVLTGDLAFVEKVMKDLEARRPPTARFTPSAA
jgi:hypothetical protein